MYIKPPSTAPYSTRQLRLDNPNTSFPANTSDELLSDWGVYPVEVLATPSYNPQTHKIVLLPPVEDNGKWVQQWGVIELSDQEISQQADFTRQVFKASRAEAVEAITITTQAGNTFDGDEESQTRMARAILALPDGAAIGWVLADNSVIQVTASELREALALAGAEQARLWVK